MAIPVQQFSIVEVKKPNLGQNKPGAVTADVVFNTRFLRGDVRGEWDELKEHDVLFLLTIRPPTDQEVGPVLQYLPVPVAHPSLPRCWLSTGCGYVHGRPHPGPHGEIRPRLLPRL